MFAQLGDIRFNLITYFDGLNASSKVDYAEHATIEGKPKLQYIGEGLETINIKLNFHTSFCNPSQELKKLKAAMAEYKPLAFIFGNGEYKGNYVIEEITSEVSQTFKEGTPMGIDVELKLKEWVKDKVITMKKAGAVKKPIRKRSGQYKTGFEKGTVSRQRIVGQE